MNLTKAELKLISIALGQRIMAIQDAITECKKRSIPASVLVKTYEENVKLHVKIIEECVKADV